MHVLKCLERISYYKKGVGVLRFRPVLDLARNSQARLFTKVKRAPVTEQPC
jgi:hypothetical protein